MAADPIAVDNHPSANDGVDDDGEGGAAEDMLAEDATAEDFVVVPAEAGAKSRGKKRAAGELSHRFTYYVLTAPLFQCNYDPTPSPLPLYHSLLVFALSAYSCLPLSFSLFDCHSRYSTWASVSLLMVFWIFPFSFTSSSVLFGHIRRFC